MLYARGLVPLPFHQGPFYLARRACVLCPHFNHEGAENKRSHGIFHWFQGCHLQLNSLLGLKIQGLFLFAIHILDVFAFKLPQVRCPSLQVSRLGARSTRRVQASRYLGPWVGIGMAGPQAASADRTSSSPSPSVCRRVLLQLSRFSLYQSSQDISHQNMGSLWAFTAHIIN